VQRSPSARRSQRHGWDPHDWTLSDAHQVARHLHRQGLRYADVYERLNGPRYDVLLAGLAMHLPSLDTRETAGGAPAIVIAKQSKDAEPAPYASESREVLPLDGGYVAVIEHVQSVLDQTRMSLCFLGGGTGPGACHTLTRRFLWPHDRPLTFADLAYPAVAGWEPRLRDRVRGRDATLVVMLASPAREGTWRIALADDDPATAGWHIDFVSGAAAVGGGPGRSVSFDPARAPEGRVAFRAAAHVVAGSRGWPPAFREEVVAKEPDTLR
jgi:hypothetical protein